MGRIKTTLIKRMTNDLISEHRDELTTDFEKNKTLVATRIMKQKEQ
jgi:ribosomal protein S17E